jgi:anaerobic ribonucleoside-triphosphate reductase activating protein
MAESRTTLNIGAWQVRSTVNGPGVRFVLWLQGCQLRCPGCVNEQFQPIVARNVTSITETVAKVLTTDGIEGITYTGGEPMLQAHALALLSEILCRVGLTVVCYTGYTLNILRRQKDPWVQTLLDHIDVLIDGAFLREQAANLLWRGSRNQQVHFLTDIYRPWEARVNDSTTQVEFTLSDSGFTTTGVWPAGLIEQIEETLQR